MTGPLMIQAVAVIAFCAGATFGAVLGWIVCSASSVDGNYEDHVDWDALP